MAQEKSKPRLSSAAKAKRIRAGAGAPPAREETRAWKLDPAADDAQRVARAWKSAHGGAWVISADIAKKVREAIWPAGGKALSRQRLARTLALLSGPGGPLVRQKPLGKWGKAAYRLSDWELSRTSAGAEEAAKAAVPAPAPGPAEEPPAPAGAALDRLLGAWLNRFVAAWAATHGLAEWVSASNVSREVKEAIWPGGRPSGQTLGKVLKGLAGPEGPLEWMPSSSASKSLCYRLKVPAPAASPEPAEEPPPAPPPGGARIQRAALEASLASADLAGMAGAAARGLIRGMGGRDAAALAAAAFETAAALLRAHLRSAELAAALLRARPRRRQKSEAPAGASLFCRQPPSA